MDSFVVGDEGTVNAPSQLGQWNHLPATFGGADKSQAQDGHLNAFAELGTWTGCPQARHLSISPEAAPSTTRCFKQWGHLNSRSAIFDASQTTSCDDHTQIGGERKHRDSTANNRRPPSFYPLMPDPVTRSASSPQVVQVRSSPYCFRRRPSKRASPHKPAQVPSE